MAQALQILKKDVRRHWPEILISLALLAVYARHELQNWPPPPDYFSISPFIFGFFGRYISFLLVLSWIFLICRVVQGETLVGDRQWWITKPYVWWQLLLSKLLFILVFIWVPLFSVQLFLLHHPSFPVLPNLGRLFLMQFTLPLILFISSFALASVTRTLGQALLGIGIVVVVVIVSLWVDSLSIHTMGGSAPFMDTLEGLIALGSVTLVPVWQFARRRTRASRITLSTSLGAVTVLSLIPFSSRIEESYPLLDMKDSPAQFATPQIAKSQDDQSASRDLSSDVSLSIPVNISGIAPGSVVLVNGIEIRGDTSDSHWTRGWQGQYGQLWPGSQGQILTYETKRMEYEKVKSKVLNLRIQLALSEYQEADGRTLILPPTTFRDSTLGICKLIALRPQALYCRKPFHSPAYIGRFDGPNSPCKSVSALPNSSPTNLDVAYTWAPPWSEILPDPGLNPIVEYEVSFNSASRVFDTSRPSRAEYGVTALCPGAEIRLARPVFRRSFRIQLELPSVRLQDLVEQRTF
jgi:hypothetical protein